MLLFVYLYISKRSFTSVISLLKKCCFCIREQKFACWWHYCCICFIGIILISGGPSFSVSPCSDGEVILSQCVLEGSTVTILCTVDDTSINWISDSFSDVALITSSFTEDTLLNMSVRFEFVDRTTNCFTSSATFLKVQPSINGLVLNCQPSNPAQSRAVITIFIISKIS